MNKVKKSMKSGAGTDDVYKPKLVWCEKADAIWRNVISGRESSSNLVSTRSFRFQSRKLFAGLKIKGAFNIILFAFFRTRLIPPPLFIYSLQSAGFTLIFLEAHIIP